MRLFNTKTQQIEQLQPPDDQVILYTAGYSPGEEMPIDHLFLYHTVDVLVCYLEKKGLRVKYAQIVGDPPQRPPTNEWSGHFAEVMQSLNMRPPDYYSETGEEAEMVSRQFGRSSDIRVESADSPTAPGNQASAQTGSMIGQIFPAQMTLQTAAIGRATPDGGDLPARMIAAEELLRRFSGDAIRIYLAQHHYRKPWAHDQILLKKAARQVERLSAAMNAISTGDQPVNIAPVQNRFRAALDNDLDTIKAIATLLNLADEIIFRAANEYQVDGAQAALREMASVFGLCLDRESPECRVIAGWRAYRARSGLGLEMDAVS